MFTGFGEIKKFKRICPHTNFTVVLYNIYCEDLSLKATDAEEIEPTLEDIWEYYQGGRENG